MNYQFTLRPHPLKMFVFGNRKCLINISTTIFVMLQYTNLIKPSLIFSCTKWWWILIYFMWAWKVEFFHKDMQLWLAAYITMDFICNWPIILKNDENNIACLVVWEVTIYLAFIDDRSIQDYFLLLQLIVPLFNRKHNLMCIDNHHYCQPNLHHNKHTFVCFHKQYDNSQYWDDGFGKHSFWNTPRPFFFVNSIVIIDVPIEMHMALAMVDIHIGMYFTYGYCLHYH